MATMPDRPDLRAQSVTEYKFLRKFEQPPVRFAEADVNLLGKVYALFWKVMSGMVRFSLFVMSPSIFAMGFIAGIISDDYTYTAMAKIHLVWMQQNIGAKVVIVLGSIIALPVVFSALSFFSAANISGSMYQELQYPNITR